MDYLGHPKGLAMVWSCLMSDYEYVMHQYTAQNGWSFSHFAKCAKNSQITLLYHATVGLGRKRDVHHERVGEIILNTAKELWLHPGKLPETNSKWTRAKEGKEDKTPEMKPKPGVHTPFDHGLRGDDVLLKYQLGAFFLTYIMYDRQPYTGLLKINMDPKDYAEFEIFHAKVLALNGKFVDEYKFILKKLRINNAFVVKAFADKCNVVPVDRSYLNAKNSETADLAKADRRVMDALAHSYIGKEAQERFKQFMELKRGFLSKTGLDRLDMSGERSSSPEFGYNINPNQLAICNGSDGTSLDSVVSVVNERESFLSVLQSHRGIEEMATTSTQIQEMAAKPMFTHTSLLGNHNTSRQFMKEATKRLKRLQTLSERYCEDGGTGITKIAKKPYKKDSGVFGRVKDDHLGEDERQKVPTRMKASYNLWNYIRCKGFNPDRKDTIFDNQPTNTELTNVTVDEEAEENQNIKAEPIEVIELDGEAGEHGTWQSEMMNEDSNNSQDKGDGEQGQDDGMAPGTVDIGQYDFSDLGSIW